MFSLEGPLPNISYAITAILSLCFVYNFNRKFGLSLALCLAWMLFSALNVFAFPQSPYDSFGSLWVASCAWASASTVVTVFLNLYVLRTFDISRWFTIFRCIAITNAIYMLTSLLWGEPSGFLLNPSMSGCFNACVLPFFFYPGKPCKKIPVILLVLSILATHKNQPIALLFLVLGVKLLRRRLWKETLAAIILSVGVGKYLIGKMLFNPEGRTEVWRDSFHFWKDYVNPWFGTGLGTFYFIGPALTAEKYKIGFIWLHSDWLQVLFEMGLVGALLFVAAYIQALCRSWNEHRLFTSLIAFGAFGIANFPMHNPISGFFGLLLILSASQYAAEQTLLSGQKPQANFLASLRTFVRWRYRSCEEYRPEER